MIQKLLLHCLFKVVVVYLFQPRRLHKGYEAEGGGGGSASEPLAEVATAPHQHLYLYPVEKG